MFDLKWIRDNPTAFDQGRARRGLPPLADRILELDAQRRADLQLREEAKAKLNELSKRIGQLKRQGGDATELLEQAAKERAIVEGLAGSAEKVANSAEQQLDALLFPGASGAGIAAKPGYPTVIVPFGLFVPQPPPAPPAGGRGPAPSPYPEGFTLAPAPYGVSFTGMACSEPRLIELAYAFEQATKRRVKPAIAP